MLVPLSTFRDLADEGSEVHLFTYLHVREDALDLFAFMTEAERSIFRALISVSGIGPKLGLAVLSGLSPEVTGVQFRPPLSVLKAPLGKVSEPQPMAQPLRESKKRIFRKAGIKGCRHGRQCFPPSSVRSRVAELPWV